VQSLGLVLPHTDTGRAALADAVEDSRPAVRIAAVEALGTVAPDAPLLAHIERALNEEPSEQVAATLRALIERWRGTE
jgi:HEAT repeat protein